MRIFFEIIEIMRINATFYVLPMKKKYIEDWIERPVVLLLEEGERN